MSAEANAATAAAPPKRDRSPDGTTTSHSLPPTLPSAMGEADVEAYERRHVHQVYNAIATHFSSTRYKPWPRVVAFLAALPPYATVADVGCGNGKYFAAALRARPAATATTEEEEYNKQSRSEREAHRWVVGMDYSGALLQLTQRSTVDPNLPLKPSRPQQHQQEQPYTDCLCCDGRQTPFRAGTFDAAISIAVIHHYATVARRRAAVMELLRLVRPDGGQVLLYVWALDDDDDNNNNKEGEKEKDKTATAPPVEDSVLPSADNNNNNNNNNNNHKKRRGPKPKSNNNRKTKNQQLDVLTGDALIKWQMNQKFDTEQKVFERFYHFFTRKELEELCVAAAAELRQQEEAEEKGKQQQQQQVPEKNKGSTAAAHCRIKDCYQDCENWCIILERYVD